MSTLPFVVLPAHARQLLNVELADGGNLRSVRTELHRVIEADQPDHDARLEDVAHRISLVATELAGNALRHGRPPVFVRLLHEADCYLLDVSDQDPQRAPEPVTRPAPISPG